LLSLQLVTRRDNQKAGSEVDKTMRYKRLNYLVLLAAPVVFVLGLAATASAQTSRPCGPVNYVGVELSKPFTGQWVTKSVFTAADGREESLEMTELIARDSQGRVRFEKSGGFLRPRGEREAAVSVAHEGETPGTNKEATVTVIDIVDCPNGKTIVLQPNQRIFSITQIAAASVGNRPYRSMLSTFLGKQNPRFLVEDLGYKEIDGIQARGIKVTQIGAEEDGEWNGKPIVISKEWASEDLAATLVNIRSDVRKGGSRAMTLTNIKREEPDASLFEIPPDYKIFSIPTGMSSGSSQPPR
jgi:hypothetical protein